MSFLRAGILPLRLLLSLCACYSLTRLQDFDPRGEGTAYIPLSHRRNWSFLAAALTVLCWFTDAWWALIPALAAHLAAMICRNARITWDKKRFQISGMLGIPWDYEYAQVRYLPGKWPLIVTSNGFYILWPGMVMKDTFIAEATEHVRVARYSQIYRKRAYKDTKQNAASRNVVASGAALAVLLAVCFAVVYWPITADTGVVEELTLRKASIHAETSIDLAFDSGGDYLIPLNDATRALLEPEAIGKTYTVQSNYQPTPKARNSWYRVLALSDEDGTVYRTWQESAAVQDDSRPYGLATFVLCWFMFFKSSPKRRK